MLDSLPIELVIEVLQHTAWQFVADDRTTVVHMAQTSKMVHQTVASILYYTMWVTDHNINAIKQLVALPSSGRVCGLVRDLVMLHPDYERCIPFDLFASLESVIAFNEIWPRLPLVCASLRSAHIWSTDFDDALELSGEFQQSITHLVGDVSSSGRYNHDPGPWLNRITQPFTNLTHLGFEVIEPSDLTHTPFGMVAFEMLLRAALSNRQLQVVAIRFAGRHCSHFEELQEIASRIDDARLRLWCDMRPINDRNQEIILAVSDALHRKGIWTEAVPASLFVVHSLAELK